MYQLYPAPEHRPFHMGGSPHKALLVHGFPGTPWEVRHVGRALAERGWEVTAPLLPGFGPQIDQLGAQGHEEWLAAVETALHSLEPGRETLLLVGYSMGAALVTRLAHTAQFPADALVLINPFSGVPAPLHLLLPMATRFVRYYRPFLRADFDDPWTREVLARVLPDLDPGDVALQKRVRNEVRLPFSAIEQVHRAGAEAWRVAPEVRAPTLIVQGSEDRVVPAWRSRAFARRLGGRVRYREIPGAHRLVWPGQPGFTELVAEVLPFADALTRSGGEVPAARDGHAAHGRSR